MKLTDKAIKNAKPEAKIRKLFDGNGLLLLVYPNGSKYWSYKYRYLGKEKSLSLGVYPEVGLADARDKLINVRKLVSEGKDPSEVRKADKRQALIATDNTFEVIAREWHESRKHMWTPKHASQIMHRLEAYTFPKIGSRPIAEITAAELLTIARTIEARGASDLAHRVTQYNGQVFTYALVTQRVERNPATDLRGALKPVKKKHHAFLTGEELPEFLAKLESYDGHVQTKLALKFMLLTFVRTGELRGAEWTEIDMDKAEWRIPAERMKMRHPHILPLSKQALEVLKELKLLTGQWRYVFPNQHKPSGFMSENTILYAIYRLGYHSKATGHGIRATASTILNEHSFPVDVIERQLAHMERNQVRASYNHAHYLPERRKMMQWWGDYLDAALNGGNKVIAGKFGQTA